MSRGLLRLIETPLQPIDRWYSALCRGLEEEFGEKWHDILDQAPQQVRDSFLALHQAATLEVMRRKRPWLFTDPPTEKSNASVQDDRSA